MPEEYWIDLYDKFRDTPCQCGFAFSSEAHDADNIMGHKYEPDHSPNARFLDEDEDVLSLADRQDRLF